MEKSVKIPRGSLNTMPNAMCIDAQLNRNCLTERRTVRDTGSMRLTQPSVGIVRCWASVPSLRTTVKW